MRSVIIRYPFDDPDALNRALERVIHDAVTIDVVGKHDVLAAVLGDKKRIAVLVLAEAVSFRDGDDQTEFLLAGVVEVGICRSGGRSTVRICDRP